MTPASSIPASQRASKRKRSNGLGSVYRIAARNKWAASIFNVQGIRVTKYFELEEEAWSWLDQEKKAKHLGISTVHTNPNQTLAEYLLDWVERNRNHKKPSTSRNYEGRIKNQIIPHIGKCKIVEVSPRLLEDLILNLISQGFGAGTVKGVYRTLSAAFADGFRLGDLPNNPMLRVKIPRLRSNSMKHIPDVDAAIIYSHASEDPYMHARVELGMVCGLRPGEVLGLLWSDLDIETKQLHIRRQVQEIRGQGLVFQTVKQDQERVIYLSEVQIEIMHRHRSQQDLIRMNFELDEGLLFPNQVGRKLDHRRDDRKWKALLSKAGVPNYSRYQMRKTAFTNLYAELKDVRKLMEYSGHSQVSTVMASYVFVPESYKEEIRRSIDAVRPSTTPQIERN